MRPRLRTALAVSLDGMLVPFATGALVATTVAAGPQFVPTHVNGWQSALFLGSSMAVTAFPVLARIVQERGLSGTRLGNLVLAASAIDDVVVWSLLALVLATMGGNPIAAGVTLGGAAAYAGGMLLLGRPLFRRVWREDSGGAGSLGAVLVVLMLGSWYAEALGIHAIFGAFVFGLAFPRGPLATEMATRLEPVVLALLLPLFFTYSGLNTSLGLLDSWALWGIALAVFVAACFGKIGGCALAARLGGEERRSALGIGALMNARGLIELILLNVGLERGLLTPTLFTIMVLMAIATTVMASPLFALVCGSRGAWEATPGAKSPR